MKKGSNPPPPAGRKPAPPANPPGPGALIIAAMADHARGMESKLAGSTQHVLDAMATPAEECRATHMRALTKLEEAERKAWESLSGYKFVMFGYWAGQWVLLKTVLPGHRRNPFASLVRFAKEEVKRRWPDSNDTEVDNG